MAVCLWIHSFLWWSDWTVLPNIVHVGFSEVKPFAIVDLELPFGGSITAFLSTFDLENVHATVKSHAEIELGRFTRSPDVRLVLLHNLSVNHCHTSESKICWDSELPRKLVSTHWEFDSVVETNIFIDTLAKSLVGQLGKRDNLVVLTVSLGRLLGLDGLVEGGYIRDHISLPIEGLDVE
jgi:hypothetical protein